MESSRIKIENKIFTDLLNKYSERKGGKFKMTNELYHHGIDGQKHGIRRFQNLDGSLTPAGRERYGVGPARDKSRWGIFRKKTSKKTSTSRNAKEEKKTYKPVSEMSDKEINDFLNRYRLETQYKEAVAKLAEEEKSAARKFVDKSRNELINKLGTYGAQKLGELLVDKTMDYAKTKLGLKTEQQKKAATDATNKISEKLRKPVSKLDRLRKQSEEERLKAEIAQNRWIQRNIPKYMSPKDKKQPEIKVSNGPTVVAKKKKKK